MLKGKLFCLFERRHTSPGSNSRKELLSICWPTYSFSFNNFAKHLIYTDQINYQLSDLNIILFYILINAFLCKAIHVKGLQMYEINMKMCKVSTDTISLTGIVVWIHVCRCIFPQVCHRRGYSVDVHRKIKATRS